MVVKGYFFSELSQAQAAVNIINVGEGIPVHPSSTTKTYCEPQECVGGWYIIHDSVTEQYLGTPVDIEPIQFNKLADTQQA
jgi:hypothetical protein